MKPVICFGEALIDFLNFDQHADGPITLKDYRQYPGGAPANAAVAIAKLGGKSYFAGQVGNDAFGHFLEQALITYQVNTQFLAKHASAKTALAFVMLDNEGDRSFSFYRDQTADVLFSKQQIDPSWFAQQALFHFCSNTLTDAMIAETTQCAVAMAKQQQSLISFDVNLRHNLWSTGKADIKLINDLVYQADLIKFSRDEFEYLAENNTSDYLEKCFEKGVSLIVITDGEKAIEVFTKDNNELLSVPQVNVVDTTAGGDSFSGALLFALSQLDQPKQALTSLKILKDLITFAACCGAQTVAKPGAFPALPHFDDVKQHWPDNLPLSS